MTDRKFKTIAVGLTTLAIVVIIATVGVWAAVQTTLGVGTRISFTATGVKGDIYASAYARRQNPESAYEDSAIGTNATLGGIDLTTQQTVNGHAPRTDWDDMDGFRSRFGNYIGSYDYGGNVNLATQNNSSTLVFNFVDFDDDGLIVEADSYVWIFFFFVNTGENRATVSFTLNNTSSNFELVSYHSPVYHNDENTHQDIDSFSAPNIINSGSFFINESLADNEACIRVGFKPLTNASFTNDNGASISITISKYVAP